MPLGLIALALGGFGIGLTEFVIAGLLSPVAADLGVSVPTAGYLISGYALAVVVGALALTPVVNRWQPKRALQLLMVLFTVGNAASALAPGYAALLGGRVLAALAHGAFFGIGAVLAATLVAPEKKAGAISIMFGGLTIANVLGVPLGTFIGQQWGWRATFAVITVVGLLALAGITALVPDAPASATRPDLRAELSVFRNTQVWYSLVMTVLVFGGMFGAFMYIEPLLTRVTGFSDELVPWLLVLFGLGLFLGNLFGGRWADRALTRTLIGLALALAVALAAFALLADSKIAALLLLPAMGFFGFGATPGLQMRVLDHAGAAPTLASSANIAAFNVGNFLGVWLSGLAISAGFGWVSPLWVGVGFAVTGLAVLLVATRSRAESPTVAEPIAVQG
ncbi:MFS transporter [Nocardia neocaledoniensis NBRC 108232]|uniref:DHA1 family inner membrane transport protein n=1 Tax=Nocardia neocaledoniensis TaxID=236511 RepID=A0A317NMG0_9NOCA|nr:MFS transporter [Nocardia neocaledoniensis]PWV76197.1 DHA1 family inner membrane transport protein [Nocardia neocaledoniensis]GEM32099.1 MFS transporter [Nocardia neocaledoniensis NBRC 108232]